MPIMDERELFNRVALASDFLMRNGLKVWMT
jgi:hypothetical protein